MRTTPALLLLALWTAACTGTDRAGGAAKPAVEPVAPRAGDACARPLPSPDGVTEVPAGGGEVAALGLGEVPPRAGTEVKIVWRVTGDGDLRVTAERPDGSTARLAFGPERHETSTFSRPGDEWGTGFEFDVPGCWRIELRRDGVSAELPVQVAAAR